MLVAGCIFASLFASIVNAAPGLELHSKRQSIAVLSQGQITAFRPFTYFAGAAYCDSSTTIDWSCGPNCAANSDFIITASGGDGNAVQFWYVGFSPSQATVIVAHQGTNLLALEADLTDLNVPFESLDSVLFPGIDSSIKAESGFANEQAQTATTILSAVQTTIVAHNANQVTIVGHSLGAAIALLDVVYLPLHIGGVSFRMIGYGMPQVGNQAFVDYIDAHRNVTHINNKRDPIPVYPGLFGYRQPSGEVHIMENGEWVSCPGQDNTSKECTAGVVPNVLLGNVLDHFGPYDGISVGSGLGCYIGS